MKAFKDWAKAAPKQYLVIVFFAGVFVGAVLSAL